MSIILLILLGVSGGLMAADRMPRTKNMHGAITKPYVPLLFSSTEKIDGCSLRAWQELDMCVPDLLELVCPAMRKKKELITNHSLGHVTSYYACNKEGLFIKKSYSDGRNELWLHKRENYYTYKERLAYYVSDLPGGQDTDTVNICPQLFSWGKRRN